MTHSSSSLAISSTEAVVSTTATFLVGGKQGNEQGVGEKLRKWGRRQPYGPFACI